MRHLPIMIGLAASLAACNKSEVAMENASIEEVSEATADVKKLDPGLWKTTVEIVSVDMPGVPAAQKGMADAMTKAVKSRTEATEYCVTKEESEQPPAKIFGGNGDCKFEKFLLDGRELRAKMLCKPAGQPGQMAMTMAGNYGGKAYDLTSEMTTSLPAAQGSMAMIVKAKVSGARIGDCKKS